jgi:hypothetical protein
MSKESITAEQIKKLHQLENMALMLDKACKDGVVVDDDVEKAQDVLNSINEKYQDDNDILGPDAYLIYEVQGLIHWVKGEEKDAKDLIRSARDTKGDPQLFTDSANDLVGASVKNDKKKSSGLIGGDGNLFWAASVVFY